MSKLVKPQNTLKQKVGHGGFKEEDLEKAQKAIEENTVDFKPIALELLSELGTLLANKDQETETILGKALDPLMQLRAQGTLFHYPSITLISDVIVDFLDTEKSVDKDITEILVAYKKAAEALIAMEVKSDQDKTCKVLVSEIKDACLRYQKKGA